MNGGVRPGERGAGRRGRRGGGARGPWGLLLLGLLAAGACRGEARRDGGEARAVREGEAPPGGPADPVAREGREPREVAWEDTVWGLPREIVDLEGIGYDRGRPGAPISVVEFSDFGCPYCRKFHEETYPTLHREFVETGKVRWKYVPFVLGIFPNGLEAARAGECAGEQDRFFEMAEHLFDAQKERKGAGDPEAVFLRHAAAAGLDPEPFTECYRSRRREERIQRANRAASRLGVRATPTFFVDGFPVQGAVPVGPFQEFLTVLLREKGEGEGPGS